MTDHSEPRVSVGVPVHNAERFLPETLAYLRAQELTDIEIIISDNASSDSTQQICEDAAASDPRVRYIRSENNRGMGWNFNRTLELARAPYFVWNSSDDLLEPSYIRRCVEALESDDQAVLAFSRVRLIDANSKVIGELGDADLDFADSRVHARIEHFLLREAVHISYGVLRTETLRRVGGLPVMRGDDIILGVLMLMQGTFAHVPEQLFRARRHPEQGSMIVDVRAQVREHRPDARIPLAFPQWRINAELYRCVARSSLSSTERMRCILVVARSWSIRHWRYFPADVKRNVAALRSAWASRRGSRNPM